MRVDKVTQYHLVPKYVIENGYKARGSAHGMIAGPYGVTISNGAFVALQPIILIRDKYHIWRDEHGERLDQPSSSFERVWVELIDSFGRNSFQKFNYHVPALDLLELVSFQKISRLIDPQLAVGVVALAAVLGSHLLPTSQNRARNRCIRYALMAVQFRARDLYVRYALFVILQRMGWHDSDASTELSSCSESCW